MAKTERSVFDTGPLIHLSESNSQAVFRLFGEILVPDEVKGELDVDFVFPKNLFVLTLSASSKDLSKLIAERFELDLGESCAIALAKQENVTLFFTDDLNARTMAKAFGLEVHGTLSIIVRAFREGILTEKNAFECLDNLHLASSMYLTSDLVNWAKKEIKNYSK